jgi:lipopolysaccharide export system permease protein
MLFHSSIRTELARSFGATLVVLFTIVLTVLLIRTLGLASRGSVNPEEVMLVLGYTVLSYTQTILTLALFIAIVSTLSRMYRESEMIIWFASGRSLGGFISPVIRFAWPVLSVIALMVLFVWPWANQQTADLRNRFENRGDLQRIAPGQFQESSSGRRVFFIDKDSTQGTEGRNVFISSIERNGNETVTSATSGRIEWVDDRQFLMLNSGQRLENDPATGRIKISEFEQYGVQIGVATVYTGGAHALRARNTIDLVRDRTPANLGELSWRIGIGLTALNLVLLAVASTVSNPRAGRSGNLMFTLFAFIVYFNMLNVAQRWVGSGQMHWGVTMLALHGSVFAFSAIWLVKRHLNLRLMDLPRLLLGRSAHAQTPGTVA